MMLILQNSNSRFFFLVVFAAFSIFLLTAPKSFAGPVVEIDPDKQFNFAEKYFSSAQKARQGLMLYSIASVINIGLSLVSIFVWDFDVLIMILVISLIVAIVAIVGEFMLANGFLEVFSSGDSSHASSSSWNDPTEPTFQSYGAPTTTSQPSTFFPPPSESIGKKYCTKCGTPLDGEAKFCGNCGTTQ